MLGDITAYSSLCGGWRYATRVRTCKKHGTSRREMGAYLYHEPNFLEKNTKVHYTSVTFCRPFTTGASFHAWIGIPHNATLS